MVRYIIIGFIFSIAISFTFEEPKYHKVPALPGDGVYSLLRRYQLDQYSCNHSKFYKLNNLSRKSQLKVGRYYYVPIRIYKFNGKTIRSTIGKDDWSVAKRIEDYNQNMLEDGYKKYSFKADFLLWVPHHELNCNKKDLPSAKPRSETVSSNGETDIANRSGNSRKFPIFGKKYEYVPLQNNSMRGEVYYIVSGHGGRDPGAVGKKNGHQLCEDEYAYDVALRLCRNLVSQGATAYMIIRDPNDGIRDGEYLKCDQDEVIWGGEKIYRQQKPRLFQRSNAINELYEKHKKQGVQKQRTIVIHVDSRGKRQQTDLFFYYHPDSPKSKVLAKKMHYSIKKKYQKHRANGQYHGTVTGRDLHMLRETKTPSVYVELGNIKHPFDQKRIVIKSNRDALGRWLLEGLK